MFKRVREALDRALEWGREQSWFPERKVVHGAIVATLTAVAAYVLIDVHNPIALAVIVGASDKITEWLVPASPHDAVRQRRRRDKRQRID